MVIETIDGGYAGIILSTNKHFLRLQKGGGLEPNLHRDMCIYVCGVRACVCIYIYIYIYIYVCVCVGVSVCIHVCVYICICVHI